MAGKASRTRIAQVIFLVALMAVPLYFLWGRWSLPGLTGAAREGLYIAGLEDAVREKLPVTHSLQQLGVDLRFLAGQREQNGIFISEEALMRNIDPPNDLFVRRNAEALGDFARQLGEASNQRKLAYLAVIPTSGGVLQQYLPRYAQSRMVDQKRLIEDLYSQVSENVRTVDVYSTLHNRREQYIYYRTENNLTALGGYYTYHAIGRRLGLTNRALSRFEIEYADHAYLGDLYQASPYEPTWRDYATAPFRNIAPDTLSLFHYSYLPREYTVTHSGEGGSKVYHTLYPEHLLETDNKMDVYLGGVSAVTDIRTTNPTKQKLLVFGDKAAGAYLPFLANHYQQVTLVNLYHVSGEELAAIKPMNYDQVLFAYSIETYIHTSSPSRVAGIEWDAAAR